MDVVVTQTVVGNAIHRWGRNHTTEGAWHTEASVIFDNAAELWLWRRQLLAADGGCCAGGAGFADDFRSLRH